MWRISPKTSDKSSNFKVEHNSKNLLSFPSRILHRGEMKQNFKRVLIFLTFTLILTLMINVNVTKASTATLNLATKKPIYDLGEKIDITGNLTVDGTPVTDALITIQIINPRNETIALRSVTTGTNPSDTFMEILEFYPHDQAGNPKYSFKRGEDAGFQVKIKNNALSTYTIKIPIYIQYPNEVPFKIFNIYQGTIDPGQIITVSTWPVSIPYNAPLGTAKAYANVINKYPQDGGIAYALEKNTTFQITSTTMSTSYNSNTMQTGNFGITISTNPSGGILGNYTFYAISKYQYWLLTAQTTVPIILRGDVTGPGGVPDNKVDTRDVAKVSKAFGTSPPSDPICDLNKDNKVDTKDVAIVSLNFGKFGTLP
jgi:hypothetical protein